MHHSSADSFYAHMHTSTHMHDHSVAWLTHFAFKTAFFTPQSLKFQFADTIYLVCEGLQAPSERQNWTFQSQHGLHCDTTLQPFHKHNSSCTSHLLHMYNLTTNVVACRMFCSRDTFRNIINHNYNIYLNSFCHSSDKL